MPIIRQLSPSLVNKIAAGEVIERPASVVKELLENSVDAGATHIDLAIEGGGIEQIRISDNGCGISADQIPLALASHATSKLVDADDLFDVHTLGFRGEALASIAEVSHLTLRSRTADSDSGAEVTVRGGQASEAQPAGCPVGTTIEVRQLFFNTPVRKKFLRTPQTEAGHITEAFTRIALAFPHIRMRMTSGERVQFDLPETDSWKERVRAFFGDETADSLIAVSSQQDEAIVSGYVANPSVSRSNNRMQYLFLNGRFIRDRSLQHALGEAYRGLLMVGRFPICFLRLDLPPAMVDVNVHPTKMEVRFQESGKLYSQLLRTLRHEFLTRDLTARPRHVPGPAPASWRNANDSAVTADDSVAAKATHLAANSDDQRWQRHADQMTRVAPKLDLQDNIPAFRPFPSRSRAEDLQFRPNPTAAPRSELHRHDDDFGGESRQENPGVVHRSDSGHTADQPIDAPQASDGNSQESYRAPSSHLGFQVHNRYLVTQDETGMVVVDQHALHERILYEQLREKSSAKAVESQRLLVPEPIDLMPAEAAAALDHKELLAQIGIQIEPFGGDTVLMTGYPAMLAKMRPAEVLRQVLEPLMSGGREPSARDMLDELLHMMACKAAVKAGDRLAPEEITALLEQRNHYQDTHHCPHGRPTALFFSREQLDKMFGRT
ncbi:MAG: DNA mismatch repair endonuclease MutL [bacterium]|nr:DNA mismatch repair endonuclease MutL [bacterium]